MFEFIRTHRRLTLGFLLLLIIPSFVFFGIEGYTQFREANAALARIDGRDITRAEFEQAHQRAMDRLRQQAPGIDPKLLDSEQARRDTLDAMVRERVLLAAANRLHLVPGDDRLQRLFLSDPQFQGLRNPDGSVNRELLAAQGMNSEMFAQQLRTELGMRQVLAGVALTPVAGNAAFAAAVDPLLQRREVQLSVFDAASFRSRVSPTDADLEAYHKANEATFRTAEEAAIEYVVLDVESLARDVAVPEEDLKRYYEENASRWSVAEERRASHILVKAEKDMPAAEREKARKRAEALLADLRKSPQAFADLARKNSDDPGSATRGGDLDFFGRGAMVKPFEDAVFSMKPGEISNVVETDFGFHVIQLTSVRGGQKKPLEAVRAEVEAEVRKSLAQRRFAEAAEQFTNTVYEQPDSLQPVLDKLKLQRRAAVVRRTPMPGASGPLASAKLLDAVFAADSLAKKQNTAAVETGPSQLVSARVVEHRPSRTLPLAEVRDRVRERVVAEQAAALARKEGQARLEQVKEGKGDPLPVSVTLSRAKPEGQPRPVVDAALGADPARLPATLGVDLGPQGYAVVKVLKVLPREPLPDGDTALRQQWTQAVADAEARAYLAALKKRFDVELREKVIAQVIAAPAAP